MKSASLGPSSASGEKNDSSAPAARHVQTCADHIGCALKIAVQIGAFTRLHQPQVARGVRQSCIARDHAKDCHIRQGVAQHRFVAGRSDIIEDHASHRDARIMRHKPGDQGRN